MELLNETWVPTWVMVLVVSVLTVSLLAGVPLARAAGLRRGKRLAHPEAYATKTEKAKDTGLFLAALIPTLLVWLAVMGVSFIGLTGFAADVMGWDHWTNVLVPLSLDGISISFGAWAFVAVKRGRHPGRAYKIVLAAATVSAMLNFVHGRDKWSIWAGLYLAFLSFAGMAMFHELLDQFMAGYDDEVALKTRYPRFGQRWLYAPISSFAARRAWIVEPPEDGIKPSIRNALAHLDDVREAKRQRKLGRAYLVREESQAKLVEVQARSEVRAARRASTGLLLNPGHRAGQPVAAAVEQHQLRPVAEQPVTAAAPVAVQPEPEPVRAEPVSAQLLPASTEADRQLPEPRPEPSRREPEPVGQQRPSGLDDVWREVGQVLPSRPAGRASVPAEPQRQLQPVEGSAGRAPQPRHAADDQAPAARPVTTPPTAPVRPVVAEPPVRPVVVSGSAALQLTPATAPQPEPQPETEVEQVRPVSAPAGGGQSWKDRVFSHLTANVWAGEQHTPKSLRELALQTGVGEPSASRYVRMWQADVASGAIQLRRKPLSLAPQPAEDDQTEQ